MAGLNVPRSNSNRFAAAGPDATVNLPADTCPTAAAARILATEIEERRLLGLKGD
jgi:hypothetical protein